MARKEQRAQVEQEQRSRARNWPRLEQWLQAMVRARSSPRL